MNKQKEIINMISEEVQKAVDVQLKRQRDDIIEIIEEEQKCWFTPSVFDDILNRLRKIK